MIRKIVMIAFIGGFCSMSCAAQDYFANPSKKLFVDDDQIESMDHVTRTLHTPAFNAANPVLTPEKPWEGSVILQPGTVIYDEEEHIFKMWYNSLATRSKPDIHEFVCYATSTDGIHWTRPDLGLVDFHGSKHNNIVLKWASWTLSVIKDAYASDPSRRYKLAYWNNFDRQTKGMWVAFSPDGVHWAQEENNPVIPMSASGDTFSVMQDPVTHKFLLYHKSVIMPIRKVSRLVSDDFVHWKDDEIVLEPDGGDQPDTEFYGLSPFAYGNQYLGFLWILHTYSQQLDVQLVSSRDGQTWNRSVYRRVFLPLGFMKNGYTGHAFDSDMIMSVAPPALRDGRLYIYYSGHSAKHNANAIETEPNYQQNSSQVDDTYVGQIGLAQLPLDGFVSLDATSEGTVVTRPVRLQGSVMHVTAATGALAAPGKPVNSTWSELFTGSKDGDGEIRVEVDDTQGRAIPGYSAKECNPIQGALSDKVLSWTGNKDLRELSGQLVKFKFILRNAQLYSYSME